MTVITSVQINESINVVLKIDLAIINKKLGIFHYIQNLNMTLYSTLNICNISFNNKY